MLRTLVESNFEQTLYQKEHPSSIKNELPLENITEYTISAENSWKNIERNSQWLSIDCNAIKGTSARIGTTIVDKKKNLKFNKLKKVLGWKKEFYKKKTIEKRT